MNSLFNYTTLSTRLEKSTRTLFITLNRADWGNAFRTEMLFELESILAWCTTRVEINSIYIDSSTKFFSTGLEVERLGELTPSALEKINTKLSKITYAMMQLPQTVIVDLGEGSQLFGSEFALGADIRLCSVNSTVRFNHSHYGLVPAAGGMSFLSTLINPSKARHWVMSGLGIKSEELVATGFVAQTYDSTTRQEVISELLNSIAKQAPVQRIQSKLGLFESIRPQLEAGLVADKKIAKASMVSQDWKTRSEKNENFEFMPAKSMSYSVKLSLIKSEEAPLQEQ